MKLSASLAALVLSLSASAQDAAPVAVLGQPGLPGRFLLLSDGSVRIGADGPILSESAGIAASAALTWLEPGVRVVRSVQREGDLELTTLSGALGHGQPGEQSLWLYRSLRVMNRGRAKRAATLRVTLSRSGLALRDGAALLDGDSVSLLVSREPNEVLSGGTGETVAAFDFVLPPGGVGDLLLAMPARPTVYRPRDLPDVRNLNADFVFGEVAGWWQSRLLPDRVALGSELVTEAFHAAVGSLLIEAPAPGDLPALATSLSALARAGRGPELSRVVEALVAGQREDGGFAGAPDVGLQADLTTALSDYALFSEAPERWTSLLWRPISRSADALAKAGPPASLAPRVRLALHRAADVADAVGRAGRAEELRAVADALPTAETSAATPDSMFAVRADALTPRAAPTLPSDAPLADLLAMAHRAVLAGDAEAAQSAWPAVLARLAAQPLPGVQMTGPHEDSAFAAQLVFLVADSVARADGGAIYLLSAFPMDWRADGRLVQLEDFPSGLGPIRFDVRPEATDSVTLLVARLPELVQSVLVSPPLGMEVGGVRANGKPMPRDSFEAGPPWALDRSVRSVTLLSGRP